MQSCDKVQPFYTRIDSTGPTLGMEATVSYDQPHSNTSILQKIWECSHCASDWNGNFGHFPGKNKQKEKTEDIDTD